MNKFNFDRVRKNFDQVKQDLPTLLANQAQNFFAKSWNKQGWDDGNVKEWKEVQRRIIGTPAFKYPKNKDLPRRTRAILVKSGRLRRAVQNSIRSATWSRVQLTVDVPYAAYHNKGEGRLPKRKFMGNSQTLARLHRQKITTTVNRIWKA
jgi:phage gpG-like protein